MSNAEKKLVEAAVRALASKRGCPDMARDVMHCSCWHCNLHRALQEYRKETDERTIH